ncbi:MAG: hypothetical protein JF616_13195 [Fibrobacteres bacterium]|nr:hypothetical protein [Fibrobacterota bacterium]
MLRRTLDPFFATVAMVAAGLPGPARSALPAGPCDYLVITDSVLAPQARRLADLRHRVTPAIAAHPCVADMGDIYRAFPPTGWRWTSLRDYLASRYRASPHEMGHVALMGGASFDDASAANHVPVYREESPSLIQPPPGVDTLTTDDAYTEFFDSIAHADDFGPRFALGRIPASTPEQADAYLDKVEDYESAFPYGPQAFTYGYLSDDDIQIGLPDSLMPIQNFPENHYDLWEGLKVKPFVRRVLSIEFPLHSDGTKPEARDSAVALLNAGPARAYWVGTGNPSQFTDEKMFMVPGDLPRLRTKRLQPVVVALSASVARFVDPGSVIGRDLLLHPDGAIAFLGATSLTYPGPNLNLARAFDSAAARGGTVGAAVAAAKRADASIGATDMRNAAAYVLLGDPGLSLHPPILDLVPAQGSGPGRLILEGAGAPGDSACFQLVRIDSLPWNAVILSANQAQRDRKYVRETVVAEGRAALGTGGSVTFALPSAGDPRAAAVKVMTWNSKNMHYGHFPLESLGIAALRSVPGAARTPPGYRMRVRGSSLVLEGKGGIYGLDGRSLAPQVLSHGK